MSAARKKRSVVVQNETEYPDVEVARAVRWALREAGVNEALGSQAHRCVVKVRHHNAKTYACSGYIYWKPGEHRVPMAVPLDTKALITLRLAKPEKVEYPAAGWADTKGGPPSFEFATWQEALVAVAAHEGYHLWCFEQQAQRVAAGKPKQSEVECDWAAHRVLTRWRDRAAVTPKTEEALA